MNIKLKISIVVSLYNEAGNVRSLSEDIESMKGWLNIHEVILVNNGSTDSTNEVLDYYSSRLNYTLIDLAASDGYGDGYMAGIKMATGDIVITNHADGQFKFDEIRAGKWLQHLSGGGYSKACVFPERTGRVLISRVKSLLVRGLCFTILKTKIPDVNGQPKIFPRTLGVTYFQYIPKGFSYDLYLYLCAIKHNYSIIKLPSEEHPRKDGQSSWAGHPVKQIGALIEYISEVKRMSKNFVK